MEMPARGKHGKPTSAFPPFPPSLNIPQHRRDAHIPTAPTIRPYIKVRLKHLPYDLPRFTQPVIIEDFSTSANSLGVRTSCNESSCFIVLRRKNQSR